MSDYDKNPGDKFTIIIEKLKNNIDYIKDFKNPTGEDLSKIFYTLITDKKIMMEEFFLYTDSLDIPLVTQIETFESVLRKHKELASEEYKRVNFLINSYGERLKRKDITQESRKKIDDILFKEYGPAFGISTQK